MIIPQIIGFAEGLVVPPPPLLLTGQMRHRQRGGVSTTSVGCKEVLDPLVKDGSVREKKVQSGRQGWGSVPWTGSFGLGFCLRPPGEVLAVRQPRGVPKFE
jgi:hypothetical protein